MVKDNEIRFGNWFHHKDDWSYRQPDQDYKEFDFQWMPEDWYAVGECRLDLDVVSPIELTEEWLIKFGFRQGDNVTANDSFYEIPVGGSMLGINPNNGVVWITRGLNSFNNPALINHIHSLQNLFWCLTGRELELTK